MIKFKLNEVIQKYNQKHPQNRLTIASLSRQSGISRHALTKLSGKHGKPTGIQFTTLDKLITFFDVPITGLINYIPSGIKITLLNANDASYFTGTLNHSTPVLKSTIKNSVIIDISNSDNSHRAILLAFPKRLADNIFILGLNIIVSNSVSRFMGMLNGLNDDITTYIYSRIMAHSGLIMNNSVKHANEWLINVTLNEPLNGSSSYLKFIRGLPEKSILNSQSVINNNSRNITIIDKTSNQLR